MKWFPLTDPLVPWPEGAGPILGEVATGHSANEGEMHLLVFLHFCSLAKGASKPTHAYIVTILTVV